MKYLITESNLVRTSKQETKTESEIFRWNVLTGILYIHAICNVVHNTTPLRLKLKSKKKNQKNQKKSKNFKMYGH